MSMVIPAPELAQRVASVLMACGSSPVEARIVADNLVLATASGNTSKSERHGYGQNEFVPWQVGAVM